MIKLVECPVERGENIIQLDYDGGLITEFRLSLTVLYVVCLQNYDVPSKSLYRVWVGAVDDPLPARIYDVWTRKYQGEYLGSVNHPLGRLFAWGYA